jgi:hypothetical protein
LKKDGKISVDVSASGKFVAWILFLNKFSKIKEVESLVLSIYSLMGENVNPPIDELAKREHVDLAIQVSSGWILNLNRISNYLLY